MPAIQKCDNKIEMLARSIVYQQLSGKAAATIWSRFLSLFPGGAFPEPEQIASIEFETLRSVGLSSQKARYVIDLCAKTSANEINFESFDSMADDEIRNSLCQVKGVGSWTADMFLMFAMRRPDVFPTGDLGIRNALTRLFDLEEYPERDRMIALTNHWRPHRTIAACYLWRILDGESWEWGE